MSMNNLVLKFKALTKKYADSIFAVDYEFSENKKYAIGKIVNNISTIEFVYVKKERYCVPKSTVFVRIYPHKNSRFYFHLYELMDNADLRCTYISNIIDESTMVCCIDYLGSIIKKYLDKIDNIVLENDEYERIVNNKKELMLTSDDSNKEKLKFDNAEEENLFWDLQLDFYEDSQQLFRFTNDEAYNCFLSGDYIKALKKYKKRKVISDYEKRLCEFMENCRCECDYEIIPAKLISEEKNQLAFENKYLIKSLPFFMPVFALVFILISMLVSFVNMRGTVVPVSLLWTCVIGAVPGILTGFFAAIAFRKNFMKLIEREPERKKYFLERDKMYNGKAINALIKIVLCISMLFSLYISIIFPLAETRVYSDKIVYDDASEFPLLNPLDYYFDDVTEVFYVEGRYNEFGGYIARGSYIFCYKNGKNIDFDSVFLLSNDDVEEYVLPLTGYRKEDVIVFKSDKELEEHTGKLALLN